MSYAVEWSSGVLVVWIVLLLAVVPEFAVIAVLLLALAALVALAALAAAALVSPYLLARTLRRRLAPPATRRAPSRVVGRADRRRPAPSTNGGFRSGRTGRVELDPRRGPVVAPTDRRREPVLRSAGLRGGVTEDPHR
jgi:hypothetical protein